MAILTRGKLTLVLSAVAGLLMLTGAQATVAAQPMQLHENKIKAGLVYNLLKYTLWPSDFLTENDNLDVCLLGGDPLDGYLNPLEGRTAQQHTIRIREAELGEEFKGCDLVFIGRQHNQALSGILPDLHSRGILTVSDISRFAERGGMVELATREDQRIHLYINQQSITGAGLQVGDRLLKLAEPVEP